MNENSANEAISNVSGNSDSGSQASGTTSELLQLENIAIPLKRRRGRPRKQPSEVRIATKEWAKAFAALSGDERIRLLEQQKEARWLHYAMAEGIAGRLPFQPVYENVREFIALDGTVAFWIPENVEDCLEPSAWDVCDDLTFKNLGLRTRIVRLFWSEFLRHAIAEEIEPTVLNSIKEEYARLHPPQEPSYSPEPVKCVPERQRSELIRARAELADQQIRFQRDFYKWQLDMQHSALEVDVVIPQEELKKEEAC